jgi:hypothetical protein
MRSEENWQEMFAPILRLHRITIEQMAILEPAVVESTMATCITVLREAMKLLFKGVPKQAVYDFVWDTSALNLLSSSDG